MLGILVAPLNKRSESLQAIWSNTFEELQSPLEFQFPLFS